MKRTNYIAPRAEVISLEPEAAILATSTLNPNGGSNKDILPGEGPYDGSFRAPGRGWDSADWTASDED